MTKILINQGYRQRDAHPTYIANNKTQARKWLKENGYKKVEIFNGGDYYERDEEPSHANIHKITELEDL